MNDANDTNHAPVAESELPTSLGKVARRALAAQGITRYEHLGAVTPTELLALHGVGPKAIRILEEQLASQGRAFKPPPCR